MNIKALRYCHLKYAKATRHQSTIGLVWEILIALRKTESSGVNDFFSYVYTRSRGIHHDNIWIKLRDPEIRRLIDV